MKKIFLFLCAVFMAAPTVARAEKCYASNCKTCTSYPDQCLVCNERYYNKDGICIKGSMEYCIKYDFHDPDKCKVCEEGTYIDKNGKCVKGKTDHCKTYYDGGSRCEFCEKGYAINRMDWKCYPNNVERCLLTKPEIASDPNKCFVCEDGYGTKDGKECVPCEDRYAKTCWEYDRARECLADRITYSYRESGWSDYKTICVEFPGCKQTSYGREKDKPLCGKCHDWFTPSDDRTQCLSCPDGCNACSDTTTCTRCYGGYELNNGTCVKKITCSANCTACSSSTVCTTCAAGYSLIGGKCVAGTVAQCPSDSSMSSDGCCCIPQ